MKFSMIRSGWGRRWAISAILILSVSVCAAQQPPSFAEPGSGRKVSSYEVTLPVSRDKTQIFHIPGDCRTSVANAWASGAWQWGGRVARSIWWKVHRDCDFYTFLFNVPQQITHDFVSEYDFMNAELTDLPTILRCQNGNMSPACEQLPSDFPDFSRFLPMMPAIAANDAVQFSQPDPCQTCRVKEGIFRGHIIQEGDRYRCTQNPDAPGFRIIAIDYADLNGDGYRDAILRLFPLGIGRRMAPLVLPLTRFQADGEFSIPLNISMPGEPGR